MCMYAVDIYYWNRYRVNYVFIFGFKQGTELGFREVLLLGSGLAVLTFAGVVSNLDMDMDPRTRSFSAITELVPLGLLIVSSSNNLFKISVSLHKMFNNDSPIFC